MREWYKDILNLTKRKPVWFDEHGVPRYCLFQPYRLANIYADECVLLEIQCKECGTRFKVAVSTVLRNDQQELGPLIMDRSIEYGQPPNINCCSDGPSRSSISIRTIQYWQFISREFAWSRNANLENIDLRP